MLPCTSFEWIEGTQHLERLDKLASFIRAQGYHSFELFYQTQLACTVDVRMQKFESFNQSDSASLEVVIYQGHQEGRAVCAGMIWHDWIKTVEQAIIFSKLAQPDCFLRLPEKDYFKEPIASCDLFIPTLLSGQEFLIKALELEAIALEGPSIVNSEGASVSASYDLYCVLNSQGLRAAIPSSVFSQSVYVMASQHNAQESDGASEYQRNWSHLTKAAHLGALAAQRAAAKLNAKSVTSGQYPIIFSPRCSGSLIKHLFGALSGRAQYLKASFLEGALGQQVLPAWISLQDNPRQLQGPQSFPIDSDGLATYPHRLIDAGTVKEYILSYYAAQRLGLKPNALGSGLLNTTMTTNAEDLKQLVSFYPKCIVVDQLTGTGVNIVTGDYSRGADGFYYEQGECLHALESVTIASNLKDMLRSIVYHADDAQAYKGLKIGTLALGEMAVSGR